METGSQEKKRCLYQSNLIHYFHSIERGSLIMWQIKTLCTLYYMYYIVLYYVLYTLLIVQKQLLNKDFKSHKT